MKKRINLLAILGVMLVAAVMPGCGAVTTMMTAVVGNSQTSHLPRWRITA